MVFMTWGVLLSDPCLPSFQSGSSLSQNKFPHFTESFASRPSLIKIVLLTCYCSIFLTLKDIYKRVFLYSNPD